MFTKEYQRKQLNFKKTLLVKIPFEDIIHKMQSKRKCKNFESLTLMPGCKALKQFLLGFDAALKVKPLSLNHQKN